MVLLQCAQAVPNTWSQDFTPIPTSGNKLNLSNFRGDCVSSNLGKVFNSTLNARIWTSLTGHSVLSKNQTHFQTSCYLHLPLCTALPYDFYPWYFPEIEYLGVFLAHVYIVVWFLSLSCSFDWVSIVSNMHHGEFIRKKFIVLISSIESAHLHIVHDEIRFLGCVILSSERFIPADTCDSPHWKWWNIMC